MDSGEGGGDGWGGVKGKCRQLYLNNKILRNGKNKVKNIYLKKRQCKNISTK